MSLTQAQIKENKEKIINYLRMVQRDGIEDLISFMDTNGFFTQAASTRYHQAYEGGLAEHSMDVTINLLDLNDALFLGYSLESMILVGAGHDLCKIDTYKMQEDGTFVWNNEAEDGHALKSIELLKRFITLTDEEEAAIKYHMGAYEKREYDWNALSKAYKEHSMSYYAHVADMKSTYSF